MSANRDKNQRVTFVYSNFYQLYKKGKDAAVESPSMHQTSAVLKAGDRRAVESYEPVTLIAKKIEAKRPSLGLAQSVTSAPAKAAAPFQNQAIENLKTNLKTLNDLHSRLNFMLKELEDLTKE